MLTCTSAEIWTAFLFAITILCIERVALATTTACPEGWNYSVETGKCFLGGEHFYQSYLKPFLLGDEANEVSHCVASTVAIDKKTFSFSCSSKSQVVCQRREQHIGSLSRNFENIYQINGTVECLKRRINELEDEKTRREELEDMLPSGLYTISFTDTGGEEQGTFGWIDSNVHRQQWLSVVDNRAWAINVVHKGKGIVLKDTYESRVVFRRKDNAFRWVREEDGQVFEICDLSVKLMRASGKLRMVSNGELYMAVNESTKRIVATKNGSDAAILTFVPKRV